MSAAVSEQQNMFHILDKKKGLSNKRGNDNLQYTPLDLPHGVVLSFLLRAVLNEIRHLFLHLNTTQGVRVTLHVIIHIRYRPVVSCMQWSQSCSWRVSSHLFPERRFLFFLVLLHLLEPRCLLLKKKKKGQKFVCLFPDSPWKFPL